jgi:hypothetical protein
MANSQHNFLFTPSIVANPEGWFCQMGEDPKLGRVGEKLAEPSEPAFEVLRKTKIAGSGQIRASGGALLAPH